MSTTNNSINNQIGSPATNNFLTQIRSTSGQWQEFDDQTDVHGYYSGVGSPEGVVAADIGSIYTDTGAGASGVYYKTTDTVNTGWVNIPSSSGPLVDYSYTNLTTPLATTAIIPFDNTIPQITEGAQYISLAYTPHSASNILIIEFSSYLVIPAIVNLDVTVAIFNGANDAIAAVGALGVNNVSTFTNCYITAAQVAGTTSPITFSVRFGSSTGTSVGMNGGSAGAALYGGVGSGYLKIYEYQPPGSAQVAGAFSVVNQTFTANGTYTPTPGMVYCKVEMLGGGGGGGGNANNIAGEWAVGSGGGAGEYAYGVFDAATIGVSQAVTIGAAGTTGVGAAGGNGGTTSLGALITAVGGTGGVAGVSANFSRTVGSAGGTGGAGGDFRSDGQSGTSANWFATPTTFGYSGAGGNSQFGSGGIALGVDGLAATGNSATGRGAGGGGSYTSNGSGARAGGAATAGLIIITEYVVT